MLLALLGTLLAAFVVTQIAVFPTTIYLHRGLTHHALTLDPRVELVCRFFIWITTGIVCRQWVAVHRKHHAHTDDEGDPHSPFISGFWHVQLGNVFLYVNEARKPEVVAQYAKDLKPDRWDRMLFDHGRIGLSFGICLLCLMLGVGWGLLAALIHTATYVFVLSSSINGICHVRGYKTHPDAHAFNVRTIAWMTGGEGLHNNHHGLPTSPRFSSKSGRFGEWDPAWIIIRTLAKHGLAELKPVPDG